MMLAPGSYRVEWFVSLSNENRVTSARLRTALFSAFSPTSGNARLAANVEPNPNVTIAQSAYCGRWDVRCAMRLEIGAGVEKIDLIRDTIGALGRSGATNARNAVVERLWVTGNATPSTECSVDVSRGYFRVVRVSAPRVVTPARPATRTAPARPAVHATEPLATVPVPLGERLAVGARVVDATVPSEIGTTHDAASVSALTDTVLSIPASTGLPMWAVVVAGGAAAILLAWAGAMALQAVRD